MHESKNSGCEIENQRKRINESLKRLQDKFGTSESNNSDGAFVLRGTLVDKNLQSNNNYPLQTYAPRSQTTVLHFADCPAPNLYYNWNKDAVFGQDCSFWSCDHHVKKTKESLDQRLKYNNFIMKRPFHVIKLETDKTVSAGWGERMNIITGPALHNLERQLQKDDKMHTFFWVKQIKVEKRVAKYAIYILVYDFIEWSFIKKYWYLGNVEILNIRNNTPSFMLDYFTETKYQDKHPKGDRRFGYSRGFGIIKLEKEKSVKDEDEQNEYDEKDTWVLYFWYIAPKFVRDSYILAKAAIDSRGYEKRLCILPKDYFDKDKDEMADQIRDKSFEGVYYSQYEKFWQDKNFEEGEF